MAYGVINVPLTFGNCDIFMFPSVQVNTSAWQKDSTYKQYPFKASATCARATTDSAPTVIFDPEEAISGNFAPICDAGDGVVYIYAVSKPNKAINVDIEIRREAR